MTEHEITIEKVLVGLSKEILTAEQVSDILNNPIEFPAELIDEVSIATALKYWNGHMDYESADRIMNRLFSFWSAKESYSARQEFPEISWQCYEAFDAGEFYHQGDDRSIDPSEKYTRPLVEKLLKGRRQID